MEIICVTTGTKCVNGDRLRLNGQSLIDCHAEILSRRCLIRYCYEQLNLFINGKSDQSIFERNDTANRFQLKTSIAFHLYISTAPCGDSRLFSPQETSNQDSKNSLRKSRGLLRRKIEVGEGTIPISAESIQTLLADERLSTMSCSDKLCRWNFIGLQGKKNLKFLNFTWLFL
jgi:double stranded RNA-specific editase B